VNEGPLDYEPIGANQRQPVKVDLAVFGAAVAYATVNVALMLMHTAGPPPPFSLIFLLLGISSVGVVTAVPLSLALHRCGTTWRSGLGAMVIFAALTWFSFWCLVEAGGAA
jgi:hypothetical protein